MENETIRQLIPLLHWRWAGGGPIRLRGLDCGETALYYSHNRHLTSTGSRLRITIPYNPDAPEHEDTVFADSGRRYPYPGALALTETIRRLDALTEAAALVGEPGGALAEQFGRIIRLPEQSQPGDETLPVLEVGGKTHSMHPDTVRVLQAIRRAILETTGAEAPVRVWTVPVDRRRTLLSVGVGEAMVHIMPQPEPEELMRDYMVYRIDNPQPTLP